MIETCYIKTGVGGGGAVVTEGGAALTLTAKIGADIELQVGFLDDDNNVIPLAAGATGRLIIKPVSRFQSTARFIMQSWTPSGEGSARRYRFAARLDSKPMRQDLANLDTKAYEAMIEYTVNGKIDYSNPIPLTLQNSYFQPIETAPPLPLGGPEPDPFHATIFGIDEAIVSDSRYAGNINRGGQVWNVRLSVADYQPGATVQILVDGDPLFTEAQELTAQTMVWSPDDTVNKLTMESIAAGAVVDVVTTFSVGTEYPVAPQCLELDILCRTSSTIQQEGLVWLGGAIVAGSGITITPDEDGKPVIAADGAGGVTAAYSGGFLTITSADGSHHWKFAVEEID